MDHKTHDRNKEGAEKQTEGSSSGAAMKMIKLDHCDLLLDAMDAHLEQLQVVHHQLATSGERSSGMSDSSKWTKSLSKDTGFESTSQMNNSPISCLDLPTLDRTSERSSLPPEDSVTHRNSQWKPVESQSHREEVMWRLGRLLGDVCGEERTAADAHPLPPDSICTEDFVRCFREEMVESPLPDASEQGITTDTETGHRGKPEVTFDVERRNKKHRNISETRRPSGYTTREEACESDSSAVEGEDRGAGHRSSQSPSRCSHENLNKNLTKFKFLAGVPLHSFDSVSIDSDLESVCTEQVRNHIRNLSGRRCAGATLPNTSTPLCKDQQRRKDSSRSVCSVDCREPNEDMRPGPASERVKLKDRLSTLRQKCHKEQETLELKKTHVTEVDLTLAELQLRRKHALQDLEWLAAETSLMGREKRHLESSVKERKAERDVLGCQLQRLRGESETRQQELRRLEEEVAARRRTGEEVERQLEQDEAEPFSAQRHRGKKLESVQQMLEETCEELQRLTRAVGSLRGRCSCLQEKLRQDKEQTEGEECKACELDQCRTRVDTLGQTLAQRDLQVLELQEQQKRLLTERNDLKRALQRLENQLSESDAATEHQMRDLVLNHEQQIKKLTDEAKQLRTSLTEHKEEADKREEADEKEPRELENMSEVDPQQKKSGRDEAPEKRTLSTSATAEEALTHLRTVRTQMQDLVKHLNQKLDSQKQTIEQLRREKDEEVITQRQQLMKERKQALEALKKRLIQEHMEELSHLTPSHTCRGGGEEGRLVGSLRRQLEAKDEELQEVQRSMAQWKEQTAARLACRFEEELTSELERTPKPSEDGQRHEQLMSDKASACRHSLCAADSSADLASLKLLRHLQTRVKQLQSTTT